MPWTKLAPPAEPGASKLDFRDIDAIDARTAYVLSIGEGPASRIYKTIDAGITWTLGPCANDRLGRIRFAIQECPRIWGKIVVDERRKETTPSTLRQAQGLWRGPVATGRSNACARPKTPNVFPPFDAG